MSQGYSNKTGLPFIPPSRKGIKLSQEVKNKIKLFRLGKLHSEETKNKISNSHKAEKNWHWRGGITKTYYKRWRKKNKNKVLLYESRRRAKKIGNGGSHTLEEWIELLKKSNYKCNFCKKGIKEIKLTKDHIIPLSKGGTDNIDNIQVLCFRCNCKKSCKLETGEIFEP